MYPDPRVASLLREAFEPVRAHVKDTPQAFQQLGARFGAHWTPTTLVIDAGGRERHRIEGFLPADDFLLQLELGLARSAFARGQFAQAASHYERIAQGSGNDDVAAEALYWSGVARYKSTGDATELQETARAFTSRHQGSSWAKKASIWGG